MTTDILDISNESSKDGIRIVLELRKGADVERLKNLLYKKTKLEDTFGVNMLAIVDGRPETLDLKGIIENHTQFYYEVTRRKYKTLLSNHQQCLTSYRCTTSRLTFTTTRSGGNGIWQ